MVQGMLINVIKTVTTDLVYFILRCAMLTHVAQVCVHASVCVVRYL